VATPVIAEEYVAKDDMFKPEYVHVHICAVAEKPQFEEPGTYTVVPTTYGNPFAFGSVVLIVVTAGKILFTAFKKFEFITTCEHPVTPTKLRPAHAAAHVELVVDDVDSI